MERGYWIKRDRDSWLWRQKLLIVIPAQAGIQKQWATCWNTLDPRLRGDDIGGIGQ